MPYRDILKKLAKFQVKHPFITVGIILGVLLILYGGISQVKTVASLEQMMPKDTPEIKAFHELRDRYMGQDMIAIVIEIDRNSQLINGVNDIREQRVMEYVQQVQEQLLSSPDIRNAYAATDIIYQASGMRIREMPPRLYEQIISNPELKDHLSRFINNDYSITIIIATTDISADDTRMKLLAEQLTDDLETMGHPPGINTKLTGTPIVQQKLGELIQQDRSNTQNISTLLVFTATAIIFGALTSAFVPILIVTISVSILYGIMGYVGLPISTLAGGVAAMVIGIGIDYAIYMMNKFKNTRKEGKSIDESIETAMTDTGTALTGAAIATILAFLAFLLGSMPEMNRFGILMAIGVGIAFVLSLFGLPAILIIEEKIIHKISKRARFGIDKEYILYENDEIHPDDYEIIDPGHEEFIHIKNNFKIVRPKNNGNQKFKIKK